MRQIAMSMRKKTPCVIGVDLGGSRVRMAFITRQGKRSGQILSVPILDRSLTAVKSLLVDSIRRLQAGGPRAPAIGIGVPGFIRMDESRIVRSPNFPGWRNVPFRDLLESKLKSPVIIENDANAAAYGETWVGGGTGVRSLIYLGLGTGVGGGVVLDQRIWRGLEGLAGELGHLTVDPRGPLCGCGNRGCLESYASATAVIRRFGEKRGRVSSKLTAKDVGALARHGNRTAAAVFAELGRALGIAIADLLNIFDPERVVIGGGVAQSWPLFNRSLMAEVRRRAIRPVKLGKKIRRSLLEDEAGMIGAARLAYEHLDIKVF